MTPRDFGPPTAAPRQWFSDLAQQRDRMKDEDGGLRVGLLFGSERYGMRNEDVYRCHVALKIPTDPKFGSLNLASAVQVIAYEWRMAIGGFEPEGDHASEATDHNTSKADMAAIAGTLAHWEQALVALKFLDPESPKKLMPRLNQLLNRAGLQTDEVQILRGIAKAILARSANAPHSR